MQPKAYYEQQLLQLTTLLRALKRRRNRLTALKLLLFLGAIAFIAWFTTNGATLLLLAFGACIALFVYVNVIETRLLGKITFHAKLRDCAALENDYLQGNLQHLDPGDDYRDPHHPYAHDLDLFGPDSLFQHVNRTVTPTGRDLLHDWLLTPLLSARDILRRQAAIQEISQQPDWMLRFRATGLSAPLSRHALESLASNHLQANDIAPWKRPFLVILPALNILSWILFAIDLLPGVVPEGLSILLLAITFASMGRLNKAHGGVNALLRPLGHLHQLIRHLTTLPTPRSERLNEIHQTLFHPDHDARQALNDLRRIQSALDQRGNIIVTILLNALYMRDLHLYRRLARWQQRHAADIPTWVRVTTELDALVSMATYRYNHPDYTTPRPVDDLLLRGEAIGHPLLTSAPCVTNDFAVEHLHEFYIITGANMAGKSTFLRAVGLNLVMATCGCVVRASRFDFRPMPIFTSMRTVDNLAKGTSYFHAELLRLQQLVDMARGADHLFIILDEILKGTNSRDKLNGSRRFLQKLLTLPVSGLVATHDLELGTLADAFPHHYFNRCFEITHTDDDISYDYKLKPGISQNMNASILLEKMGLV